jgi:hypothetical protein
VFFVHCSPKIARDRALACASALAKSIVEAFRTPRRFKYCVVTAFTQMPIPIRQGRARFNQTSPGNHVLPRVSLRLPSLAIGGCDNDLIVVAERPEGLAP